MIWRYNIMRRKDRAATAFDGIHQYSVAIGVDEY